jgi:glycosyltransferase involved in cell wall biosynthesis
MKRNVIYCAPVFGYPAIGGPELKVKNILISLSNNYDVKLILWKKMDSPEFTKLVHEKNIEVFYVKRREFKNLGLNSRILSGKALTAWRLIRHRLAFEVTRDRKVVAQSILSVASQTMTDLVWFSYSNYNVGQFLVLRKHGKFLKLIADTDSVSSRYTLRGIPFVGKKMKIKLMYEGYREIQKEIKLVNSCDTLTAVSEVDLEFYSSISKSKNTTLAYNVVDTSDYKNEKVDVISKYLIITGSFGHFDSPMDHGTRWFIESVWPQVRLNHPDLRLRIVGKNSDAVWSGLSEPDIDVFGWVPDTTPHIANAAVCIVPLWFESGTRYKILEAGMLKTPVVSTSLGAEGLNVQDEIELLIADRPDHFARQVVRVIDTELGRILSENLYRKVINHYSIKSLDKQVISAVNLASTKN